MKPTFDQTVSKLVNWYLKNELEHGVCHACVVGNLCGGSSLWKFLFMTYEDTRRQEPQKITSMTLAMHRVDSKEELLNRAKWTCESTGYSVNELKRIEFTFETAPKGNSKDDHMFNGLCAVVDVLADIHGINLEATNEAKKLFQKV